MATPELEVIQKNAALQRSKFRILVVDDDDGIRDVVADALRDAGHDVLTASNGMEALAVLAGEDVALIFLDMRMPVMDGQTFIERYRETPGPHACIIPMTAALDASPLRSKLDVDAVLGKPFDLDELYGLIDRFCE